MKKIAIVGSLKYENKNRIKDFIFKLKDKRKEIIIVSGGRKEGADKYVKKYALEFGFRYKEYNPAHTPETVYSALKRYYYGKPYSPVYYFHRSTLMIKHSDNIVVFIKDDDLNNKDINHVINESTKNKKPLIIIK